MAYVPDANPSANCAKALPPTPPAGPPTGLSWPGASCAGSPSRTICPAPPCWKATAPKKWLLTQDPKLSAAHRLSARQFIDQIITLERQLSDTGDGPCGKTSRATPTWLPPLALIQSVPGIGFIIAATILCECGDITRFDSIDQLSSYAGLCPRVAQSGESAHHGHISKQGPPVLALGAPTGRMGSHPLRDPNARRIYARIAKRAGGKKAATAVGRKLLSYAWSVCRRGQPFVWPIDQNKTGPAPVPVWSYDIWFHRVSGMELYANRVYEPDPKS